jgi:hypothetical protein
MKTNVLEEHIASIVRVTRIGDLGTTLAITISSHRASVASGCFVPTSHFLVTLMMEALSYSGTSVVTRTARRNIPEDDIHHQHSEIDGTLVKSRVQTAEPHVDVTGTRLTTRHIKCKLKFGESLRPFIRIVTLCSWRLATKVCLHGLSLVNACFH